MTMTRLSILGLSFLGLCAALLPASVAALHESVLVGPFLLQIEAFVDITLTDEERRTPSSAR